MQRAVVVSLIGWFTSFASACSSEPCAHQESVAVAKDVTPFDGGQSVFSACDKCPELPQLPGVEDSGPATRCDVSFRDEGQNASVLCLYGPGGRTSSSIANDAVKDVPNHFDFCREKCPAGDALHGCSLSAVEAYVDAFRCNYGKTCG